MGRAAKCLLALAAALVALSPDFVRAEGDGPAAVTESTDEEPGFVCDEGFYYNKENDVCMRNKCTCENGTPVTDEECVNNGENRCFGCDDGYMMDDLEVNCVSIAEKPFGPPAQERPATQVVCRNKDVKNMTLAQWTRTPAFLDCTDLLLNLRIGDSGDAGARVLGARLVELGAKSKVRAIFLTGNAIGDNGFAWLVAALGGDIPDDEDDNVAPYFLASNDGDERTDEEEEEAVRYATLVRERIGYPTLPVKRGEGLAPVEILNLYRNYISDEGLEDLADALRTHKTIREIHLSNNRLTASGLQAMLDVVQKDNRRIEQFWVDGNGIDEMKGKGKVVMHKLRRALDKNEKRARARRAKARKKAQGRGEL